MSKTELPAGPAGGSWSIKTAGMAVPVASLYSWFIHTYSAPALCQALFQVYSEKKQARPSEQQGR